MAMADKNINYTDKTLTDDDALTTGTTTAHGSDTEPATGHDTKEGGILGAVGGAVVGMLAGGPIGAVIGAVAGGAASAAAVNVVDKHDHDYDRTVGTAGGGTITQTGTITPAGTTSGTYSSGTYSSGTYSSGATAAGDYSQNTPATTGYGSSNLAQNTGTVGANGETVIPIVEEELAVGKREVQSGGAHIRTGVIETPVSEQVTLREEHVNVTRQAVDRAATSADFQNKDITLTETDEVPVVAKSARVVEEVVVGKTATERTETVHDTVRRTDVEVDELGTDGTTRR